MTTIQPGDRIRLVTFIVATAGPDGDSSIQKVNLRYSWTGADPEHMCDVTFNDGTGECLHCETLVHRIVKRRLEPGHVITGVAAIRDGQTTMLDRRPTSVAIKAAA